MAPFLGDFMKNVHIEYGIVGKYGKLRRGQSLPVDDEYAAMLERTGNGRIVEEKKPKENKAAKPKSNK